MRLRLRMPEGTTTTLEFDASTPFNKLLREVAKAAGTTPDQVSLKHGMPPTALQLAGTAPISDALQTMETVIVAVCSTTSDQQTAARPGGQLMDDEGSESEGEFADEFDDSATRRLVQLTQCAMDRDGAASPVIMPRRPTEAPPEQTPEERRAMAKLVLQTLLQREAGDNSTNYGARFSDPAPLRFSATPRPYTPSPAFLATLTSFGRIHRLDVCRRDGEGHCAHGELLLERRAVPVRGGARKGTGRCPGRSEPRGGRRRCAFP